MAVVANDTAPVTLAPATALAVVAKVASDTAPDTLAPATALAVVANVTAPDTLAPATALAVVANVTAPVTLAPATALAESATVAEDATPVKLPTMVLLKFQVSVVEIYKIVAAAPATVIPALFAAAAVVASLATVIFKSVTDSVVALIVVVVPLTVKLPPIVASPDVIKLVSVPVLVMFGCALAVIVTAVVAVPADNPVNWLPLPMKKLPVMLPVASKLVSVPTEVIFGWAAVVSTPIK